MAAVIDFAVKLVIDRNGSYNCLGVLATTAFGQRAAVAYNQKVTYGLDLQHDMDG